MERDTVLIDGRDGDQTILYRASDVLRSAWNLFWLQLVDRPWMRS